jgi:hypothetical protein
MGDGARSELRSRNPDAPRPTLEMRPPCMAMGVRRDKLYFNRGLKRANSHQFTPTARELLRSCAALKRGCSGWHPLQSSAAHSSSAVPKQVE